MEAAVWGERVRVNDPISVITVTRGRLVLLHRAMASVQAQDYGGEIEHLIIVDDDEATVRGLIPRSSVPGRSHSVYDVRRPASDGGVGAVYPRLARLLNVGIHRAASPWIAFLDDDNEFESDHLSSLRRFADATGCDAVHSARQMLWPDGSPYLEQRFPGPGSDSEQARIYRLLCDRGVCEPGSHVVRDRVDAGATEYRNSTVIRASDPVMLVDQNLWLIRRELLLRTPIPEEFSDQNVADNTCPDDLMVEALVRAGVEISTNGRPSVRYYLGGISNQVRRD